MCERACLDTSFKLVQHGNKMEKHTKVQKILEPSTCVQFSFTCTHLPGSLAIPAFGVVLNDGCEDVMVSSQRILSRENV